MIVVKIQYISKIFGILKKNINDFKEMSIIWKKDPKNIII